MTDSVKFGLQFDGHKAVTFYVGGVPVSVAEGEACEAPRVTVWGRVPTRRRLLRGAPWRLDRIPFGRPLSHRWWQWHRVRWLLKDFWWAFWS